MAIGGSLSSIGGGEEDFEEAPILRFGMIRLRRHPSAVESSDSEYASSDDSGCGESWKMYMAARERKRERRRERGRKTIMAPDHRLRQQLLPWLPRSGLQPRSLPDHRHEDSQPQRSCRRGPLAASLTNHPRKFHHRLQRRHSPLHSQTASRLRCLNKHLFLFLVSSRWPTEFFLWGFGGWWYTRVSGVHQLL